MIFRKRKSQVENKTGFIFNLTFNIYDIKRTYLEIYLFVFIYCSVFQNCRKFNIVI